MAEHLVRVPDLSAAELVAETRRKLNLDALEEDFESWDFIREERGKVFKPVIVKTKANGDTAREVQEICKRLNVEGNTAAFLAWLMMHPRAGGCGSVPCDESRLHPIQNPGWPRYLYYPAYERYGGQKGLAFHRTSGVLGKGFRFVAFREVAT